MSTETKLFELRDRATFIPAIAIALRPERPETYEGTETEEQLSQERYLLRRLGYSYDGITILLTALNGNHPAYTDPYDWTLEPWVTVHTWLEKHWDEVQSGAVLDGEFLRGETLAPKCSENSD
jgi:hypothetical protein